MVIPDMLSKKALVKEKSRFEKTNGVWFVKKEIGFWFVEKI